MSDKKKLDKTAGRDTSHHKKSSPKATTNSNKPVAKPTTGASNKSDCTGASSTKFNSNGATPITSSKFNSKGSTLTKLSKKPISNGDTPITSNTTILTTSTRRLVPVIKELPVDSPQQKRSQARQPKTALTRDRNTSRSAQPANELQEKEKEIKRLHEEEKRKMEDELRGEIKQLQDEEVKVRESEQLLREQVIQQELLLNTHKEELAELQRKHDRKEKLIKEMSQDIKELYIYKELAMKEDNARTVNALLEVLKVKETEVASYKVDLEKGIFDRQKLNDEIVDLQTKSQAEQLKANKKYEEAKEQINEMTQLLSQAEDDKLQLDKEKESLKEEIKGMAEDKKTKIKEIDMLRTQVNDYSDSCHELKRELVEARSREEQLIEKTITLEAEACARLKEIETLTSQMNAYSDRCDELTTNLMFTENKKNELEADINKLQVTSQEQIDELQKAVITLRDTEQQQQAELLETKAELTSRQLDINIKQKEIESLTSQMNAYSDRCDELTTTQVASQQQIDELQKAVITLRDTEQQQQAELLETKAELTSKQLDINIKQKEIESLSLSSSTAKQNWRISHRKVSLLGTELGRGGWGEVWLGKHTYEHRVAVKKMYKIIVCENNLKLLHREIDIMAQLHHPNLLQFIGAVFDHPSGNPMIITEVMDTSLRKAYEEKELTPDQQPVILSIMYDVALGLNYLHSLPDPIIHRDVSSANVLLKATGTKIKWIAKLSDFGSANMARLAATAAPGAMLYSAPESFQSITKSENSQTQTTKMDVYSNGILLCEALTCRLPSTNEVFQSMLEEIRTNTTSISSLHSLIVSCVEENPLKRPTIKVIISTLDTLK